ncbi:PREDICTED: taste receptor type 2 member 129-like [Nanorana parkeri]|uniref:taste receptor type 2 member 129-like n=1 Tax=Nanorana parkeri TaxID=125878 RepID=UPI000854BC4F|nr:PREDICTED: taste receptor type 2 member 129-like [Nanorana parkeri]
MDPGAVISFSVIIFEMCIGMFSGLFIVGTILKDIFKGQRMSTGDKIILSLSCSNICLLIMTFTSASASYFPFNPDVYTVCTINAFVIYSRTSCSWLTTCLCFFYFIKITQLKSSFLSLLKKKIKKIDVLIPWMILVIEALCLGSSFFSEMTQVPPQQSSNISVSFLFDTLGDNSHPGRTILYVSMFVSLLISVVITARNALSLIVHICRTGKNVTPSGRTNVKGLSKNSTITSTDVTSEPYKLRLKFMNVVLAVTSQPILIAISTTAASAVSLKLHNDRIKINMGHTNMEHLSEEDTTEEHLLTQNS